MSRTHGFWYDKRIFEKEAEEIVTQVKGTSLWAARMMARERYIWPLNLRHHKKGRTRCGCCNKYPMQIKKQRRQQIRAEIKQELN